MFPGRRHWKDIERHVLTVTRKGLAGGHDVSSVSIPKAATPLAAGSSRSAFRLMAREEQIAGQPFDAAFIEPQRISSQ
jgi:hypothetical protein